MSQTKDSTSSERRLNDEGEVSKGPKVRVLSFTAVCVTILIICGLGTRYYLKQEFCTIYVILSVFFSFNILICWWEACLFLQRTRVENRTAYWRERRVQTGRLPHVEFFTTKIPLKQAFNSKTWADIWATYAQYDPSLRTVEHTALTSTSPTDSSRCYRQSFCMRHILRTSYLLTW